MKGFQYLIVDILFDSIFHVSLLSCISYFGGISRKTLLGKVVSHKVSVSEV